MTTKEQELASFLRKDLKANSLTIHSHNINTVLSQLQFSDTAKKIIVDPLSFEKEVTGLESIASSNELLIQVRNSLNAIIDSLEQNPSILSSLTKYWGELPWWQRIIMGILVSGPTLVIGVAANIGFLITLSGLSAGAYITSGVVLEDHHQHTKVITQKLKEGVFEIADVLVLTISALDTIRQKLAVEVQKFQEENLRLKSSITLLSEQTYSLTMQIKSSIVTEKHLRQTKIELEKTAATLKQELTNNSQQYEETIKQIELLKQDHDKCTNALTADIKELTMKRKELEGELQKTKGLAIMLQGAVQTLSSTVINDAQQRENFQARLEDFVKNKEKSFTDFVDRICKTESELASVKMELKESLERHNSLMSQQSELIERLELIDRFISEAPATRDGKINIHALCEHGFITKTIKDTSEETLDEMDEPIIKKPIN